MVNEMRERKGPQLLLRFAEGSDLRDRLNDLAKVNRQSLSAEIVRRLEWTLNPDNGYDEGSERSAEEKRAVAIQNALSVIPTHKQAIDDLYKKLNQLTKRVAAIE